MWYRKSINEIEDLLLCDSKNGLQQEEVEKRLKKYGKNILPHIRPIGYFVLFLKKFNSPLVYILLIGVGVTGFLSQWIDMIFILIAVLINVVVIFWQEGRAHYTLSRIKHSVKKRALVIRNGHIKEIEASLLVPGDILILKVGQGVHADARIIYAKRLKVNEAILTGESSLIPKNQTVMHKNTPISERRNMLYMGSIVEEGGGMALVVETGIETRIGKLTKLVLDTKEIKTPLQVNVFEISQKIVLKVLLSVFVIVLIGISLNISFIDIFSTAIAVSVAAIPEGLPATISIILALGAHKILKVGGITRRLVSIETLGSTTVICVDKTGTLTKGEMNIERIYCDEENTDIALKIILFSNDSVVEEKSGDLKIIGLPTDVAKTKYFISKLGLIKYKKFIKKYNRVGFIPFDARKKYMAGIVKDKNGYNIHSTGAIEVILGHSTTMLSGGKLVRLREEDRDEIEKKHDNLARSGHRIIALATRHIENIDNEIVDRDFEGEDDLNQLIKNLTFIGFVAISDSVRNDTLKSIEIAREAGIRTMILTGDHKYTALHVGRELGFNTNSDHVFDGQDIEKMSDLKLAKVLEYAEIFSRLTPDHKLRIVSVLQNKGEVVCMTGDGINDAAALKKADIGITLDSGTDITKDVSDIILTDNSFTMIISAIRQGRIVFDNIRKVATFLISNSFSEILLIMSALIFKAINPAIPLPITAIQILYINIVEEVFPNVAMAFEPGEINVMKRNPINRNEHILDKSAKSIIYVIGIFVNLFLISIFGFLAFSGNMNTQLLQSLFFALIGTDALIYIFSLKSLRIPLYKIDVKDNKFMIFAVLIGFMMMFVGIYSPYFNDILGTVPLPPVYVIFALSFGIVKLLLIEFIKYLYRNKDVVAS